MPISMAMEKGDLRVRTKAPTTSTAEYSNDRDHGDEDDAAWMKETEEEEPLSPWGRLYHMSCLSTSVVVLSGFATKIDVDVLKERMVTLIRHPRFSSKLFRCWMSRRGEKERWVRTKVNSDDHFIVQDLDQDIENPDKFVNDYASDLSSTPFDLSKPLWEFHVLNIKISNAESVGIFKIHHSLGDGMSLVALVFSCSRKSSSPEELPSIPTSSTKRVAKSAHGALYRFLIAIWLILRLVSLDDIKLVKNETNTTVNDVVVGLTNAALSRYLHVMPGDHRRRKICVRASIAVNARKIIGVQFLASMLYGFMSNTTMMLSTVTGPAEEVDFCGHRVAYICATSRSAGGHPPGLMIHYMSYMNKMSVAVCANQDLIPDPHKILDEVEESLKLMKNAVLQRKQSKKGLLST
ncbi:Wax ester synthase/diacylglycerol acyltransferase 11-like protein [Drosera capensis]